jgi:hypothetical protein
MTKPLRFPGGFFHGQLMTEDTSHEDAPDADALAANNEPSEADFVDLDAPKADEASDTATDDTAEADAEADKAEDEEKAEDGEAEDEPKKKKLSGIDRMKRRVAALEAQLAERPSPVRADGDSIARAVEAEIGAPPKEADFAGDYLAYERAQTAYEIDRRMATRQATKQAAQQQARATEATHEMIADHNDRIEALAKSIPDIKAKLSKVRDAHVADHVGALVLESEKSAHLAVHFAENPQILAEINAMHAHQGRARDRPARGATVVAHPESNQSSPARRSRSRDREVRL